MIDQERFKSLLAEAIGSSSQQDFAKKADMSKFTLSRYVTNGLPAAPRKKILYNIARASEGRIDIIDLLHAAGYHDEAENIKKERTEKGNSFTQSDGSDHNNAHDTNTDIPEKYRNVAKELIKNVVDYIKTSVKDKTMAEWIDMFSILYAEQNCVIRSTGKDEDYEKPDLFGSHAGGERIFSAIAEWTDLESDRIYSLPFVLFYCRTEGTENIPHGVIVRDAAFDLETLNGLEIPETGPMLWKVAAIDGAKLSDYPMCLTVRNSKV